MSVKKFYSRGKLLLTGEYFILDGAAGLAIPTIFGQTMEVTEANADEFSLQWSSFDVSGNVWLTLEVNSLSESDAFSQQQKDLIQILRVAQSMNQKFLSAKKTYRVETRLEFPNEWGLGSSATLINNVAQWSGADAFALSNVTFGGSGYDIAVARANAPVIFSRKNQLPVFEKTVFEKPFLNQLFFVHLNQKQNSREGISRYRELVQEKTEVCNALSEITHQILEADTMEAFARLLYQHEDIISKELQLPKVKDVFFSDFDGAVKSLGAWGGDFVLTVTHHNFEQTKAYFASKGFETIVPYREIIFS